MYHELVKMANNELEVAALDEAPGLVSMPTTSNERRDNVLL